MNGRTAWWFDSKGYWLWRRLSHRRTCGGRWLADGGCRACDLMRRLRKADGDVPACPSCGSEMSVHYAWCPDFDKAMKARAS